VSALRGSAAAAAGLLLWGCVSLGESEPQRYYVLEPAASNPAPQASPRAGTLLVAPTSASAFYETADIAYSRASGERAYYRSSHWTERPSVRLTEALIARLQGSGSFKTVAHAASGVQGNLLLATQLTSFYHDAVEPPGRVVVALVAELIDPAARTLVARKSFEHSAPAASYDAGGAVRAFDRATGALLGDIAQWVNATAPR
jgi:cholesterol transport system auxiliary component